MRGPRAVRLLRPTPRLFGAGRGLSPRHPWVVAVCALVALAVAMGIGRFAFTPILPMMQDQFGVTVREGGWLASSNYLGYLLGALSAAYMRTITQRTAIRAGLAAITLTTAAMGLIDNFGAWMVLRFIPGVTSAWVLIHMSAWSLEQLAKADKLSLGGVVYAGVGAGIVFAGLACLAMTTARLSSTDAWIAMGVTSLIVTAALWNIAGSTETPVTSDVSSHISATKIPEFWRFIFCQFAFGLGYIIPATFLPVMAKQVISNPLWFGWAWPVFGAAAVVSTLVASRLMRSIGLRNVWAIANLVMGLGILVPAVLPGLGGIVIAAVCVGGTFMVTTMAGFQEARRVGGADARVLMAFMTSAFALGQIVGPLYAAALVGFQSGFTIALITAAVPLFIAAYTLYANRSPEPSPS